MKQRILVIEDNEQNMYLAAFLLGKNGYEVFKAFDGVTGIETAVREAPDAILLDIQLPGLDGYSVARRLRSIPETSGIPIIAVTSYAMVGDREQALAAGCDAYIEKPIDPDTFVQQMREHLTQMNRGEDS